MALGSRYRWRTILFCIVGAILFWFLNALNKVYTTDINYPVHFIIDESKEIFVKAPPSSIPLEVTGVGWRLLRCLLHIDVQPVELSATQIVRRGRIKSEHLCSLFNKHIKDLKVNRVLIDEASFVQMLPQKRPTS